MYSHSFKHILHFHNLRMQFKSLPSLVVRSVYLHIDSHLTLIHIFCIFCIKSIEFAGNNSVRTIFTEGITRKAWGIPPVSLCDFLGPHVLSVAYANENHGERLLSLVVQLNKHDHDNSTDVYVNSTCVRPLVSRPFFGFKFL